MIVGWDTYRGDQIGWSTVIAIVIENLDIYFPACRRHPQFARKNCREIREGVVGKSAFGCEADHDRRERGRRLVTPSRKSALIRRGKF